MRNKYDRTLNYTNPKMVRYGEDRASANLTDYCTQADVSRYIVLHKLTAAMPPSSTKKLRSSMRMRKLMLLVSHFCYGFVEFLALEFGCLL